MLQGSILWLLLFNIDIMRLFPHVYDLYEVIAKNSLEQVCNLMFNWSIVIMNELKGHARKFEVLLSADELIRKYEILEQEEDIWYSRKSRNKDAQ